MCGYCVFLEVDIDFRNFTSMKVCALLGFLHDVEMIVSCRRFRHKLSVPSSTWDRFVVPKRRQESNILRCVKSQKSAYLIYTAAEA